MSQNKEAFISKAAKGFKAASQAVGIAKPEMWITKPHLRQWPSIERLLY
jgi:hypothetical protein